MAYEYNGEVFVPDLGANQVWRLAGSGGSWHIQGNIPQPSGSGPRHMQIYGTYGALAGFRHETDACV
jgi:6-phosphogluconolactonase (cycloisomerase 2 family)